MRLSIVMGVPLNGWRLFVRENPTKMDDNYRMGPPLDDAFSCLKKVAKNARY